MTAQAPDTLDALCLGMHDAIEAAYEAISNYQFSLGVKCLQVCRSNLAALSMALEGPMAPLVGTPNPETCEHPEVIGDLLPLQRMCTSCGLSEVDGQWVQL